MSDTEMDGDISDEEVCSLLEASMREMEEEVEKEVEEGLSYSVAK